jgi:uncharacterized protein (DUF1501 family)
MTSTRRQFLRSSAAAIALVGLARKSSRADGPARARRVLIVNAGGGLRSTAAFNASSQINLNPWGVLGTFGALRLGNVLRSDETGISYAAPSWSTPVVPSIDQAAARFAVIAATDHAPDNSDRAGDHTDDEPRMGTGYYAKPDAPGAFTLINRFKGAAAAAPVATIGGGDFGVAPPAWVADKPIRLAFDQLPDQPPIGGSVAIGRPLEAAIDARVLERRRHLARDAVQSVINTKATLRKFGPVLADKRLRFDSDAFADETLDGITNQMLLEATTSDRDGKNVAMAIRLLQLGSPAVSVSIGGFDNHDEEVVRAPRLYTRFGRYLAGIHFALERVPDPEGGMLLDHTLVVTTSEFGRSGAMGGFNAGGGSDHGGGPAWRYQAHVVFGAGITPKQLHPTDDANVPTEGPASTHRLLATIAAALGTPDDEIERAWPKDSPLYPEGGPLWDLWA